MRKFRLNKLVRDGIPDAMRAQGQIVEQRSLSGQELLRALCAKLVEEAQEYRPSDPESQDELADLQEILDALTVAVGMSLEERARLQAEKRLRIGGFTEGLFVETVAMDESDPWAAYYAAEPDRFPEEAEQ